jgi:hypothetical protein
MIAAAREAGPVGPEGEVVFDWRRAAEAAGIPADQAVSMLKGLRRFGYITSVGKQAALLTREGASVLAKE